MALTLYMDVHMPRAITNGLRRRGVQVVTAQEDGTAELKDPPLLDRATELDCPLYTQDDDLLAEARRRQAEGVRSTVYDDATGQPIRKGSLVEGYPTIGVGHRLDLPLPDALIDALLDYDLTDRIHLIDMALPWWTSCTEPQQRALVELVFNMGLHGLERDAARVLIHLRAGRGHAASCELAGLPWANRVGPTRAQRIIQQVQA